MTVWYLAYRPQMKKMQVIKMSLMSPHQLQMVHKRWVLTAHAIQHDTHTYTHKNNMHLPTTWQQRQSFSALLVLLYVRQPDLLQYSLANCNRPPEMQG